MRVLSAIASFLAVLITVGGAILALVEERHPAETDIGSPGAYPAGGTSPATSSVAGACSVSKSGELVSWADNSRGETDAPTGTHPTVTAAPDAQLCTPRAITGSGEETSPIGM